MRKLAIVLTLGMAAIYAGALSIPISITKFRSAEIESDKVGSDKVVLKITIKTSYVDKYDSDEFIEVLAKAVKDYSWIKKDK